MWLLANLHQNFFQNLDFPDLLNLSHNALVFLLKLPLGQEVFHRQLSINIFPPIIIDWSLSGFPPQFPVIGLGGFSPATWLFKTHQLPYEARMFSLVFRFSSPVSQWVRRFFTKLYSYLHVWQSSRLKGKPIVMSYSWDLQISSCMWSNPIGLIITQPICDFLTLSFHPKILHTSISSSSPPLWALFRIVSLSL